ncbi:hypothetical protein TNCV_2280251 [Trichonephila clavipes]|nr:hypothetical protein TNCV_2280251 [Trichonephila clavipes]
MNRVHFNITPTFFVKVRNRMLEVGVISVKILRVKVMMCFKSVMIRIPHVRMEGNLGERGANSGVDLAIWAIEKNFEAHLP